MEKKSIYAKKGFKQYLINNDYKTKLISTAEGWSKTTEMRRCGKTIAQSKCLVDFGRQNNVDK